MRLADTPLDGAHPRAARQGHDRALAVRAAWGLSLNPEDLDELAYAVLAHHDSVASWDAAVRRQIADHRRRHAELRDAMRREHLDPD